MRAFFLKLGNTRQSTLDQRGQLLVGCPRLRFEAIPPHPSSRAPIPPGRFESLVYNPYNVEFARERNQCLPVTFPQVKL
jgi:hypothetical protein